MRNRLQQAAKTSQLKELAERPLLLTVMAQLHTHKGQLPDDRTQLYQGAVDLLLERWENKSGEEEKGLLAFLELPSLKINDLKDGLANHPVVGVSWYEALAFTQWLTTRLQEAGKISKDWVIQLPNEPEWERAARGTKGRKYPWEGKLNPNNANYNKTGIGSTSAVGCFPQGESPNHIEEMSGNVWEWTRSVYDRDYYSADQTKWANRELLDSKGSRVLRGGAFFFTDDLMRCACRFNLHPYNSDWLVGFRVVASPFSSR